MEMTKHEQNKQVMLVNDKKTKQEVALDWHERSGHLTISQYQILPRSTGSVLYFQRRILDSLTCTARITGKMKQNPVIARARSLSTISPLPLIHIDVSGKISPSLFDALYAIAILYDYTSKYDVFFIRDKTRASILKHLDWYERRSELQLNHAHCLKIIRLDGAGEHRSNELDTFCYNNGIKLEYSPAYASQSNVAAERNIQ